MDATGAGDGFAAGFLYSLALGRDLATCGRIGCTVAGEAIRHMGPRAQSDLSKLIEIAQ